MHHREKKDGKNSHSAPQRPVKAQLIHTGMGRHANTTLPAAGNSAASRR